MYLCLLELTNRHPEPGRAPRVVLPDGHGFGSRFPGKAGKNAPCVLAACFMHPVRAKTVQTISPAHEPDSEQGCNFFHVP